MSEFIYKVIEPRQPRSTSHAVYTTRDYERNLGRAPESKIPMPERFRILKEDDRTKKETEFIQTKARAVSEDNKNQIKKNKKLFKLLPEAKLRLKMACERAADREAEELERLRILNEQMIENCGHTVGYF